MQAGAQKFGRALVVGIAGLFSFFLLVFFVSMFFAHDGKSQWGRVGMMSPQWGMVPAVEDNGEPSFMGNRREKMLQRANDSDLAVELSASLPSTTTAVEKKVMKNGDMNLQVENADAASEKIRMIANEMQGSVTNMSFNQSTGSVKSGSMTVNVPVSKFEEAFSRLKEVAVVVLSENVSGQDVTEQYIDLQARLSNKKAAETAYQALLDKAEKVSDIIEITDKLSMVRAEIESLEGQLRYLNSQTDMASISIFVTEDAKITGDQGFRPGQTFKESVVMLLRTLGNFVKGIIMFVILGIPVFAVYGLILWGAYKIARKIVSKFWPGSIEEKRRIVRKK